MTDFGLGDQIIDEDQRLAALKHHGLSTAEYDALCACRKNDPSVQQDVGKDARGWIATKCRLCGRPMGFRQATK